MIGNFFPYTKKDIETFFRTHAQIRLVYVKAERSMEDFGHYLCEIIVGAGEQRIFLQGIEFRGNRFLYPSYLQDLPNRVQTIIEREILSHLLRARVVESPMTDPEMAYTGERIVPATAPFHAYWIHARRYEFAARRCRGKKVLDAGCGSGYGTRILSLEAADCVGVDIDEKAIALAQSLFSSPGLRFAMGDVTRLDTMADASFDAVVALEILEHLPAVSIPDFMQTAKRILIPNGTFMVSVANSIYESQEKNPYHLSEMTFDEFKGLLGRWFDPSGIRYFGQDIWEGSYRLDRECRIEPIHDATEHHIFLAIAQGPMRCDQ